MIEEVVQQGFGFATYPSVKLKRYKFNSKNKRVFSFAKELLFGDFMTPFTKEGKVIEEKVGSKTYILVRARGMTGYILPTEIQIERPLEVNFIDVGQGDGCHVVTPDDKHFIFDAGKGDNMFRFMRWRFNLRKAKNPPPPFTGVVTHSDADHYGGFNSLFKHQKDSTNQFTFTEIFHNGIVEESGSKVTTLGTIVADGAGQQYVTDLVDTSDDYKNRSASVQKAGNYIRLLNKTSAPITSLRLGSDPIYDHAGLKIEVLGPVAENINGKDALIILEKNKGITKNGHSVILKLTIGKIRMLLGGDLNSASEKYLFKSYTGFDIEALKDTLKDPDATVEQKRRAESDLGLAIGKMNEIFGVDIAKSCHHGSADFTSEFLRAMNPVATIISSGDNESHSHPRPDTLGTIGKHSRGERSLIFSTELARSSKEFIELKGLSASKKKERTVTVYGMINVRTDGEKVIIAQKLEKPSGSKNWDIHKLEWDQDQEEFVYVSKNH